MSRGCAVRWSPLVSTMLVFLALGRAGAASPGPSPAALPPVARFALIVGVNQSPDHDVLPLRYADDDAARYRDLFHAVGARTFLLATLDDNTRRLHPEAAIEALPARAEQLALAVDTIAAAVAEARRRGQRTVMHVLYAGHGGEQGHTGYVALDDGRVTGPALLEQVFNRVHADDNHLVVDACSAYLLVLGRGQGGQRRPLQGFARTGAAVSLLDRRDIGLLLSTSSARESHEWAAFQAGVFSHEVRSGLFGAADANGDGVIAYSEIQAFIARANESIPNERYRPEVFWRPPSGGDALLDIRAALQHRVEVPATASGHYYLEDPRGVRLADFHNGKRAVRLLRPSNASYHYLQRTWDGREYLLPGAPAVVDTAGLEAREPHVAVRSAAHDAFAVLFALPFEGPSSDLGETARALAAQPLAPAELAGSHWGTRRIAGWSLILGAAMGAAVSAELFVSARALDSAAGTPGRSAAEVGEANDRSHGYFRSASLTAGVAGAAALAGAAVLLWPGSSPLQVAAARDGAQLAWHGHF